MFASILASASETLSSARGTFNKWVLALPESIFTVAYVIVFGRVGLSLKGDSPLKRVYIAESYRYISRPVDVKKGKVGS
jgi:hypothetical protein